MRQYKSQEFEGSFLKFKKQALEKQQSEEKKEEDKTHKFQRLDTLKEDLISKREEVNNLKEMSKVTIYITRDKAEMALTTHFDQIHKHGYKPFIRWGVLKETLTAACLLQSGVIERGRKTGKLYLWDPFCGTGSFLIEALMMTLQKPVREV